MPWGLQQKLPDWSPGTQVLPRCIPLQHSGSPPASGSRPCPASLLFELKPLPDPYPTAAAVAFVGCDWTWLFSTSWLGTQILEALGHAPSLGDHLFSQHHPQHHVLHVLVCAGFSHEGHRGRDHCPALSRPPVCVFLVSVCSDTLTPT